MAVTGGDRSGGRQLRGLFTVLVTAASVSPAAGEAPPRADYCAMLARDIAGRQHGFIAGNHMYYVGGQCNAKWRITEHETIGFTFHSMVKSRIHQIMLKLQNT